MSTRRTVAGRTLFVFALGAIGLATVTAARPRALHATVRSAPGVVVPSNNWLKELKAKHRQFFDNPTPNGGVALVHVMNYFDTYNQAFGVKDADINAVLTFYGAT